MRFPIRKNTYWLACLLAGGLASCLDKSELVETVRPVPAEETAGFPRVPVKVDSTITLRVLYRPENGCGRFSRVDSATTGFLKEVQLFAAYPVDDQDAICTDLAKLQTFSFPFKGTQPGKYYFRFWRSENEVILDSVQVQ